MTTIKTTIVAACIIVCLLIILKSLICYDPSGITLGIVIGFYLIHGLIKEKRKLFKL